MKPQKLKHLFEQYGEVGRIYCTPEDPTLRKQRKQKGGNTGKNFTEGWVEFEDKKVAKQVARQLNGNPMGGKKRSAYHFDLWCLKYLPKFKWDNLTEEITYQRAVREQKLAAEISVAKRERDFYLQQVDKAKAIAAIQERKRKRGDQTEGANPASEPSQAAEVPQRDSEHKHTRKPLRVYQQKRPKADLVEDAAAPVLSNDLLALIGGKK
jgi:ESF2/ABP1 family protein